MKKFYEKPDAEYLELMIHDAIMLDLDYSVEIGDDEEEGFG